MTTQVLFVQGAGDSVHDQWDDKLAHGLQRGLGPAYRVRYPRMPDEAAPRYDAWKAALLNELDSLQDGSVLVGHSIGGTMLIHVLAEEPSKFRPGALCLIAVPFIGDEGWPSDEIRFKARLSDYIPTATPVFLYHGDRDDVVPVAHIHLYARAIPRATIRQLPGRNHQLDNDLQEVAADIRSLGVHELQCSCDSHR